MIRKKTSPGFPKKRQNLQKDLELGLGNLGQDLLLGLGDRHGPGGVALPSFRRQLGPDRSPVARVVDACDEPVRLETVHELRDVGAHAFDLLGERSQRQRLPRRDEQRQHAELGKGQAVRLERLLEPRTHRLESAQQLERQVRGHRRLLHI